MNKTVTLKDSLAKKLASLVREGQPALLLKIEEAKLNLSLLEQEFAENEAMLKQLETEEDQPVFHSQGSFILKTPINVNGYSSATSWWEKIQYLLKRQGAALTSKQLIDLIYQYEPELKQASDHDQKKVKINVDATLSYKFKESQLGRYKDHKEYAYGLPAWFDKSGNLKREYMI